jgi:hypothetical protein
MCGNLVSSGLFRGQQQMTKEGEDEERNTQEDEEKDENGVDEEQAEDDSLVELELEILDLELEILAEIEAAVEKERLRKERTQRLLTLLDLPDEILLRILFWVSSSSSSFYPPSSRSLFNFSQLSLVSTQFSRLMRDDLIWSDFLSSNFPGYISSSPLCYINSPSYLSEFDLRFFDIPPIDCYCGFSSPTDLSHCSLATPSSLLYLFPLLYPLDGPSSSLQLPVPTSSTSSLLPPSCSSSNLCTSSSSSCSPSYCSSSCSSSSSLPSSFPPLLPGHSSSSSSSSVTSVPKHCTYFSKKSYLRTLHFMCKDTNIKWTIVKEQIRNAHTFQYTATGLCLYSQPHLTTFSPPPLRSTPNHAALMRFPVNLEDSYYDLPEPPPPVALSTLSSTETERNLVWVSSCDGLLQAYDAATLTQYKTVRVSAIPVPSPSLFPFFSFPFLSNPYLFISPR